MKTFHTILALSAAALLAACAGPGPAAKVEGHAAHQAAGASPEGAPHAMHRRMQHTPAMQAMHEKMMSAQTQEERQALKAEHMKSMHEGMDPAKCMQGHGMHRKGG